MRPSRAPKRGLRRRPYPSRQGHEDRRYRCYDSDALDQKLADEYDIELIAPNRQRRSQTQDGRKLCRYRSALESGMALRLDAPLPPPRHPMGIPHRELPRLCSTRLPSHLAQAFMKLHPDPLRGTRSQEYLFRNHPNRPQPRLHQLRPSGYWKLRAPQPERMPALRVQMHLHGNPRVLQRNVVSD